MWIRNTGTFALFFLDTVKSHEKLQETVEIKVFSPCLLDKRFRESQKDTDPTNPDTDPDPQRCCSVSTSYISVGLRVLVYIMTTLWLQIQNDVPIP